MSILDVIAVVAIVGYVIGRQLVGEPLRSKRLIALPLILTVVGAVDLAKHGHHPGDGDVAFIAVEALVALVIGLGQGSMMRLEAHNGTLWGQMPRRSLWLWLALVASHGALDIVSLGVGAHVAASSAPILMTLGINRLAQAVVIGSRTLKAGIPFTPEKDGSTFLAGTFGSGPTQSPSQNRCAPGPGSGNGPVGGALTGIVGSRHDARHSNQNSSSRCGNRRSGDDRRIGGGGVQNVVGMTADWIEGRRSRR